MLLCTYDMLQLAYFRPRFSQLPAEMSRLEQQPADEPASDLSAPRRQSATRLVVIVSGAVGFAIMGDSLLYVILPLAAVELGLGPVQVGLLLSANRLVRLFSNTWLSALFTRFGPYRAFVLSAILGVLTTAAYGLGWGFVVLLLARLAWGVSWSGLRQGTFQSIWTGENADAGRLMGLSWGIVRGGSGVSALLGGFLFGYFGYEVTVWTIAALSALAIPIAFGLTWPASASPPAETGGQAANSLGWRSVLAAGHRSLVTAISDPLQRSILLVGFFKLLLNSILIATASIFVASRFEDSPASVQFGIQISVLSGIVVSSRWFSDLAFGAVIGTLADWVGRMRLTIVLLLFLCLGLATMLWVSTSLSILALVTVLILSTGVHVVLDAYANQAALVTDQPQMFVGAYATASDLGSAVGPLFAFTLVSALGFAPVYGAAALLFVVTVVQLAILDTRLAGRQQLAAGH